MRVAIVDRFAFVAEALRAALEQHGPIEVVGVFQDGSGATLTDVRALAPDLVLVEMKTGGAGLIRRIRAETPAARILALTAVREPNEEMAALAAGATAYLEKGRNRKELITAIVGSDHH